MHASMNGYQFLLNDMQTNHEYQPDKCKQIECTNAANRMWQHDKSTHFILLLC